MGKSLIQVLLSKFHVVEEKKISPRLQHRLENMESGMRKVMDLLDKAEAEASTDAQAARWLHQVTEVAYETEDMLDNFLLGTSGSLNWWTKLIDPFKWSMAVYRISRRVDSISPRVEAIGKDDYYRRSKNRLAIPKRNFQLKPLFIQEHKVLIGIEKPVEDLTRTLECGKPSLTVHTILGEEGVGKTTLARQVHLALKGRSSFTCSAWINISQPILWEDLFRSMIVQFYDSTLMETPHNLHTMKEDDMKRTLTEFLGDKRYFLILDGVWSLGVWEYLKVALPKNNKRSRVLISTRLAEVAYSCGTKNSRVFIHRPLGHEHALELLRKKMDSHACFPSDSSDYREKLLNRCSQMPLAIVALGGLLSAKQDCLSVVAALARQLEYDPSRKILDLSFTNLPSILRYCIMYLGLFPMNYPVRKRRLFRLWMAEGFVEGTKVATPEEVAEGYLNELVRRNLVEAVGVDLNGGPRSCCLHSLTHEIVASYFSKENFGAIFSGYNRYEMNKKTRRLSVHCELETELDVTSAAHICSFLMFSNQSIPASALQMICLEARLLRVLDLSNTNVDRLPREIGSLVQLRYLGLRNSMVSCIPGCIGRLKLLETLDLKGTRAWKLPGKIAKLKALKYLAIPLPLERKKKESAKDGRPDNGVKLPKGIDKLSNLQKLSLVNLGMDSKRNGQLEKLTQLRSLGVAGVGKANAEDLLKGISKMKNLRSLTVLSSETDPFDLPLSPTLNPRLDQLENLQLDGCSLNPLLRLQALKKIVLRRNNLTSASFKTIQELPSLLSLDLAEVSLSDEVLHVEKGKFNKLHVLLLKGLSTLKKIKVEDEAMPNLKKLQIKKCTWLDTVSLPKEFIRRLEIDGREDWRRISNAS